MNKEEIIKKIKAKAEIEHWEQVGTENKQTRIYIYHNDRHYYDCVEQPTPEKEEKLLNKLAEQAYLDIKYND